MRKILNFLCTLCVGIISLLPSWNKLNDMRERFARLLDGNWTFSKFSTAYRNNTYQKNKEQKSRTRICVCHFKSHCHVQRGRLLFTGFFLVMTKDVHRIADKTTKKIQFDGTFFLFSLRFFLLLLVFRILSFKFEFFLFLLSNGYLISML